LLDVHKDVQIIGEASNTMEAIELIESKKPDLLFLDIQMPQWNGFDLLEKLNFTPQVIFTTAYDQYAVKAFEVNALDYLLKPINPERLNSTLENCQKDFAKNTANQEQTSSDFSKQIFIKDGEQCHFIRLRDIRYLKAYDNYVRLYFNNTSAMIKKSLNALEERLHPELFFRCNRAEVINLQMIKEVQALPKGKLRILLQSGEIVDVSERKSAVFRERMGL
ncbi:MAG: LytR/AlgR family response regulator transcription factor, partial [Saprospiraceae bacterium]